jgi:hypothetical protein
VSTHRAKQCRPVEVPADDVADDDLAATSAALADSALS